MKKEATFDTKTKSAFFSNPPHNCDGRSDGRNAVLGCPINPAQNSPSKNGPEGEKKSLLPKYQQTS